MNLKITNFPINIKSIKHIISSINNYKTPIRIFHNFFLKDKVITGKTIDLGAGKHSSYLNFFEKKNVEILFADKIKNEKKKIFKVNLEKKIKFKNNQFDSVLLLNVLEHITNYKNLIKEIKRITKKGGRVEIFVPFMHRFHPDPNDVFRPTHYYLNKMLLDKGFKVQINLIGVGPFAVISEIILKYFKLKSLKIFFFIFFLFLDKLMKFFSKDYNSFYLGIHCSCKKY